MDTVRAKIGVSTPNFLGLIFIFVNVVCPFFWNVRINKYGGHRAFGFTEPAINTFVRMYEHHVVALINAIYGADSHAGLVFDTDTRFCDDVWHGKKECTPPQAWSPSDGSK